MSRERRVLALGAAAIALIVGLGRGLPRLLAMERAAKADALRLVNALETEKALLAEHSRRTTVAASADELAALRRRLVRASSPLAAAALVQRDLAAAARVAGIELTGSSADADPAFLNRIDTVGVQLTALGSASRLAHWLVLLTPEDALVRVRELTITQSDVHIAASAEAVLHISVVVEALVVAETEREADQ